mmetsp:Transcript_3046/g.10017  ORF Transcript_3046/g.10017 Transcript_3046/m.10017 type:complete len:282 (+) Transcript_3046:891-1736(+)
MRYQSRGDETCRKADRCQIAVTTPARCTDAAQQRRWEVGWRPGVGRGRDDRRDEHRHRHRGAHAPRGNTRARPWVLARTAIISGRSQARREDVPRKTRSASGERTAPRSRPQFVAAAMADATVALAMLAAATAATAAAAVTTRRMIRQTASWSVAASARALTAAPRASTPTCAWDARASRVGRTAPPATTPAQDGATPARAGTFSRQRRRAASRAALAAGSAATRRRPAATRAGSSTRGSRTAAAASRGCSSSPPSRRRPRRAGCSCGVDPGASAAGHHPR